MHVQTITASSFYERSTDSLIILSLLYLLTRIHGDIFNGYYILLAIITLFISYHAFKLSKQYQAMRRSKWVVLAREILMGWGLVVLALVSIGYITHLWTVFSGKVLLTWFIATPLILLARKVMMVRAEAKKHSVARTAIVVGINDLGLKLYELIGQQPNLKMTVHGFFDDRSTERHAKHLNGQAVPLLGSMAEIGTYVREHNINAIYISQPMSAQPRIVKLLDDLKDSTASVYFLPDIFVFDPIQARFDYVGDMPVMAICETPFIGVNNLVKRGSDIVLAILILLLLAPLMGVIALAVKWTSPGPIIFKQRRYGLDGEEIMVYKFRSMTVCEDGARIVQAKQGDQRMTRIGAFLRKTSLDELPQFINVLQGRMSIVGPRPHAVAHNELYRKQIKGYMLRHKVRPGITGWAQVNGLRGETETLDKMAARIEYDLDYLKRWSLSLDLWIVLRTVKVVCARENAY